MEQYPGRTLLRPGERRVSCGSGDSRTAGQAHAGRPKSRSAHRELPRQWLYLRNLKGIAPDPQIFPDFDDNLRQAFQRETELFFGSVMREDRSVVDLINADYTFVNERLAKHYGIPNVYGNQFRKVTIPDATPRPAGARQRADGVLDTESHLAGVARQMGSRRISWERRRRLRRRMFRRSRKTEAAGTMRARAHGRASRESGLRRCHKVMDPIGFSLENFDAIGAVAHEGRRRADRCLRHPLRRLQDRTASALRALLAARPEQFVRTMTEMLMTYALGRGLEYYDMPVVRTIERDAAQTELSFFGAGSGHREERAVPDEMTRQLESETSLQPWGCGPTLRPASKIS